MRLFVFLPYLLHKNVFLTNVVGVNELSRAYEQISFFIRVAVGEVSDYLILEEFD